MISIRFFADLRSRLERILAVMREEDAGMDGGSGGRVAGAHRMATERTSSSGLPVL
jgi:hypothetical protein